LVNVGQWVTVLVDEVKTDVFCVFDEGLLLLHEEVSVLGHPFIDVLLCTFIKLSAGFISCSGSGEAGVLEMLIGLFEIEELAFYVEGSHV
jgi:hypothetical protein